MMVKNIAPLAAAKERKYRMEKVKGYKVFNPDWTCRNKQYTCPGVFEEDVTPSVCNRGMHFCKRATDCFNYYSFNPENKVAEVIAPTQCTVEDGDKCATNYLEIVREISWQEVLGIVNTGKGCTGLCNSGDQNSGNCNTGDWNSGDKNSGNCNTGDRNSGDRNSGDKNSGNCNTGNRNSGNRNSGDWNKTNFSNGCFNTIEPKIYLFNKPSAWTYRDWLNSDACSLLNQIPGEVLEYVWYKDMTDEEKAAHPEAETTGGYLKEVRMTAKIRQAWWDDLSTCEKKVILSLPNFDAAIFKEITGIDVENG